MSVKLIVDSGCDIPRDELVAQGAGFLPLRVMMGGVEYLDGVDLSAEQFYTNLVEKKMLPSTSQIPPSFFGEAFRRALDKDDEVLCLALSSRLSGTCESALAAVEALPPSQRGRVHVVDTQNVSIGEQVLVRHALSLIRAGASAAEVAQEVERRKKDVRVYALLDTLEYLKRGGRISGVAAAAGALLNVKPIIAINDGAVESVAKARGMKAGRSGMAKLVREAGGVDMSLPFVVAYSGLDDTVAREFAVAHADLFGEDPHVASIGTTIGAHVGPGAIGVAFFHA